jgi:antitoxin ParD1/3/4
MRTSQPITVTLGKQQASLEAKLKSGRYESASEVMRAALRALDREEVALDEMMREKVREAMERNGPGIPAAEVFTRLRERHAKRFANKE